MHLPWRPLRWAATAAILAAVVWRTGTGPFVEGVRALDLGTLALGALIAVPTTVACAWRWHLVAGGLGVGVAVRPAVASCYRAQFLNTTLPGGILGDVHRGVLHGRGAGDTGRALRAVLWERFAGQVVQAVVAAVVLLTLASPVRLSVLARTEVLTLVLLAGVIVAGLARRPCLTHLGAASERTLRALLDDLSQGLLARRVWPGVVLASTVAVAGYVATYLMAARAAGVTSSELTVLPLAMLVLVAAALPLNIAGWGPREGMAAWSFAAAGLGADQGVATATAYGVMVLVASLPGAIVMMATARRGSAAPRHQSVSANPRLAEEGAIHG